MIPEDMQASENTKDRWHPILGLRKQTEVSSRMACSAEGPGHLLYMKRSPDSSFHPRIAQSVEQNWMVPLAVRTGWVG